MTLKKHKFAKRWKYINIGMCMTTYVIKKSLYFFHNVMKRVVKTYVSMHAINLNNYKSK